MSQHQESKFKIIDRLFFFDVLLDRRTRPILIYVTILVLIGGTLFHWLEGWDWLDSFYFVVITLTTVGYGDFSPTTPLSKIITIFFGVNGIIVMMMLYDLIRRLRRWELTDNEESTSSQT